MDQLKEGAYAKLDKLPEDHVMTDNSPNPIHVDEYTSIGAGPSYMPSEQPNCSVRLASDQGSEYWLLLFLCCKHKTSGSTLILVIFLKIVSYGCS